VSEIHMELSEAFACIDQDLASVFGSLTSDHSDGKNLVTGRNKKSKYWGFKEPDR
jgi:hypothetical protein